jgi:hypothetical protein
MPGKMMPHMPILSWTAGLIQKVEGPDIRDIKGPLTDAWLSPFILTGIFISLLTGFLLFYLLRTKIKKKVIPVRTPDEIAYEALDQLKTKNLPEKGRLSEHYSELSGIIRNYLKDLFHLNTLELTTEELLQQVEERKEFSRDLKTSLSQLLIQCDLVKFAKYIPLPEGIESSFKVSREIIEQTKEGF